MACAIAGEFLQFLARSGKQLGGLIGQRGIPGSSGHAIAVELNPQGQFADKPISPCEPVAQVSHGASSPDDSGGSDCRGEALARLAPR